MPESRANKAVCILHANCLGDALAPLLESVPAFSRCFTIHRYTNYTREVVKDESRKKCALYLYQYLAPKWGELASDQIIASLPKNCTSIEIPNFLFRGYWPFWTSGDTIISFCNRLIEDLLAQGLSPTEAMHIYLKGDPAVLGDVATIANQDLQNIIAKEHGKPITYGQILASLWQEEQLFLTVNHPNERLIFHVAAELLRLLGLGNLPESCIRDYKHPYNDFWQPIHPAVGKMLSLPFVHETRRYRIYENLLTHREYTGCYLACRTHGERELLVMLKNLPAGYHPL